jgi:FkbM family methyltransferase
METSGLTLVVEPKRKNCLRLQKRDSYVCGMAEAAQTEREFISPAFDRFLQSYARSPNHPAKLRVFHWLYRTFRTDKPLNLNVSCGLRMKLRPTDHIESCLIFNDWHEEITARFIMANLSPGQSAFVAGAHIGYFVMLCARAVGNKGIVIACEPAPENLANTLDHLQMNNLDAAVTILCAGLSDKPGLVPMHKPPERSRGLAVLGGDPEKTAYLARVTTIEQVLQETESPCPDLLQLDIEGFEWPALEGLGSLRPRILVIEYDPKHFARVGLSQQDFADFVRGMGYDLFTVTGDKLEGAGYFTENNLVAVRRGNDPPIWPHKQPTRS